MTSDRSNRFSWSAGGIAGSAVGASLWMPATALASHWPLIGIGLSLATASIILVSAYGLWRIRKRLSAYRGLMVLLAVAWCSSLLFFVSAQVLDWGIVTPWPGGDRTSPSESAWVLLLFPALAGYFWLLNRSGSRNKLDAPDNESRRLRSEGDHPPGKAGSRR